MERSSGPSLATVSLPPESQDPIVVLVGPEGGWTQDEQRLAQEQGFLSLTLGPRILRAETAAIAALSILQSRLDERERDEQDVRDKRD